MTCMQIKQNEYGINANSASTKSMPRALAHVILGSTNQFFIAIEDDFFRFPIEDVRRVESRIEWLRSDGAYEFIDTKGSIAEEAIINQFDGEEGVLLAIYPDLSLLGLSEQSDVENIDESRFYLLSCVGALEIDFKSVAPSASDDGGF